MSKKRTRTCMTAGACLLFACSNSQSNADSTEGNHSALTANGVTSTLTLNDWGSGYCANVLLTNTGSAQTSNWTITFNIGTVTLSSSWSANFAQSGGTLTATPLSYNAALGAGASTTLGFCANGAARPSIAAFTVNGAGSSGSGGASGAGGAPTGGTRATTGGAQSTGGAATAGARATGGNKATGGTQGSTGLNPPITGSNGFATRYWDCCKPSCSWTTALPSCTRDGLTRVTDRNARSGCESGGVAFECYDFSPWYDASTNMSYGFTAYNAAACGACYELQFTGNGQYGSNPGATAIKGQQMIVQAINIGNIASGQFDLLIPGGGVGQMTTGCPAQWGSNADLGATYGGLLTECGGDPACMKNKCQTVFGAFPSLLAGCNWFTGWFHSADNPQLIYKQVPCPPQITSKSGISG